MLETVEAKLRSLEDELAANQQRATGLVVTIQQYAVRMAQRESALEQALSEAVVIKAEVQRLQDENRRLQEQAEKRAEELRQLPVLRGQLQSLKEEIAALQEGLLARARECRAPAFPWSLRMVLPAWPGTAAVPFLDVQERLRFLRNETPV